MSDDGPRQLSMFEGKPVIRNRIHFKGKIDDPVIQPLAELRNREQVYLLVRAEVTYVGFDPTDDPAPGEIRDQKVTIVEALPPDDYIDPEELMTKLKADNEKAVLERAAVVFSDEVADWLRHAAGVHTGGTGG